MFRTCIVCCVLALVAPCTYAAEPAPLAVDTQQITPILRQALITSMPSPLGEKSLGWGQQHDVVVGMKWHNFKPTIQKSPRNDGHWQKVRLEAINPDATLMLLIENMQSPEPHRTTFHTTLALDVRMIHNQQLWKSGVRLMSNETRGRCRLVLKVNCELTSNTETPPGKILPDVIFRIRVTEADVTYRDLVCEHVLGMDGQAAKLAGEALHRIMKQVKPQYERDLLNRTNTAIVRAADTKEVRLELEQLIRIRPK